MPPIGLLSANFVNYLLDRVDGTARTSMWLPIVAFWVVANLALDLLCAVLGCRGATFTWSSLPKPCCLVDWTQAILRAVW